MEGMGDSKEFAGELFDALARRRKISTENGITQQQLREFWVDMTDEDLDSRLQIFFDMLEIHSLCVSVCVCVSISCIYISE